ncbi:DNA polymerase IV [Candidatus Bipolaricaulota sp. J31]
MGRWILHVDMDAFYASVEQLDNPELRGKPVIVGGLGPRGVVATASYEARRFGVRSAMPMAKARKLCPHGIFLPPRFDRYAEVAERIRKILYEYTPLVEPVSLDEAFLDLTGTERLHGSPECVAREIHRRIPAETGLTCSVGLAPNKLVAKVASDRAKPGGLSIVFPEDVQGFLDPLPVEVLWGVGPVTAARLESFGIRTVRDLRGTDPVLLSAWFGPRAGAQLSRLARGIDESPVVPEREAKSLSQERTFPVDLHDPQVIRAEVRKLALAVADRLHAQGYLARLVRIKVRFARFVTHTRQMRLPEPTDNAVLIAEAALALLARLSGWEEGVRLLGVGVGELVPAGFRTLHLFASEELSRTILEVRRRFGADAVTLGPDGNTPR